jgi:UDP-glucuronate 4-epimerase
MRVFVTGSAGFIGYHLASRLLRDGHEVCGYDAMTPYYDVALKRARHGRLRQFDAFGAHEADLGDAAALEAAIGDFAPEIVVHLAAQAGVRYSLEQPRTYVDTNIGGTFNLLEILRKAPPRHLLFASTSSVYGANPDMPFAEADRTDLPMSLYAATKKAGEAMSHSYAHLFGVPTTCFRFFTVYGPWGRPDMALFKFAAAMLAGEAIEVYGEGKMGRDFTYVDDLVEAIMRLIPVVPDPKKPVSEQGVTDSLSPVAPWRVVNIAGGAPQGLMDYIAALEKALGVTSEKRMLPMQPGDVAQTHADPGLLRALTGYVPDTPIETGVAAFADWFRDWHSGRTK